MNHIDLVNRSLVSVIIPTYKRATTLLDAIRSVLNQTYKNIEIVIVDDNGKGTYEQLETERLLKQYIENQQIIYIVHEYNKNGSAARNTGLMASHGAYINFLDDDDKMYPQKIEKQVQRLEFTDESIGATYCNSQITHYQNITHKKIVKFSNIEKEGNLCIEYILGKARFNTSMIMFKRSAIEYIGGFGIGTQKIEEMIQKEFPDATLLRMDSDTTTGKEGHMRILEAFRRHEADILIGTQMIVKGHDFPTVTLVGIIAADMTLHISDFRSSEKTFELLVQAAGRAGRGECPGEVVIQTYKPEHYVVQCAGHQDYKEFYEQEIAYRSIMNYPPKAGLMTLFVAAYPGDRAHDIISTAQSDADRIIGQRDDIVRIGPAPHPISRANDMYRYLMHFKGSDVATLEYIRDTIIKHAKEKYGGTDYIMQFDMQ